MTTTTKPIRRVRIGITTEQAATFMRSCWKRYQERKGNTLELDEDGCCTLEQIMRVYDAREFREDLRDCGWCLGHSGGFTQMAKAHDLAIKGLNWNKEGHDFSRAIDYAFSGIAGWMA